MTFIHRVFFVDFHEAAGGIINFLPKAERGTTRRPLL